MFCLIVTSESLSKLARIVKGCHQGVGDSNETVALGCHEGRGKVNDHVMVRYWWRNVTVTIDVL